jgi:hypothetical protein
MALLMTEVVMDRTDADPCLGDLCRTVMADPDGTEFCVAGDA